MMPLSQQELISLLLENWPDGISVIEDYDIPLGQHGLDSLDMAAILIEVEEKYEFKIPDGDIDGLITTNDIVSYAVKRCRRSRVLIESGYEFLLSVSATASFSLRSSKWPVRWA